MRVSKSEVVVVCICLTSLLGVFVWFDGTHAAHQHRAIRAAVKTQVVSHESQIEEILAKMHGMDAAIIEQAIYDELQMRPSSSLITRSMINVNRRDDGRPECRIDTSSFGVEPRMIRTEPESARRDDSVL